MDVNADDINAVVFSHEAEESLMHVGHVSNPRGIKGRQADKTGGRRLWSRFYPWSAPTPSTLNYDKCRYTYGESYYVPNRRGTEEVSLDPAFRPKPAYLATWANMGNELMQSFNSMFLEQLADSTVLLLRAIKYK